MRGVFRVVFGYVFHVCDCVIVCYTLHGKLIHGMMYMGGDPSNLKRFKSHHPPTFIGGGDPMVADHWFR